jgi:hypothetical protein
MRSRNTLVLLIGAILLSGALALAACGGSDPDGGGDQVAIDGSWKGTLNGSGDATFDAYVEIDTLREGSVSGTVYYPGIDDAGACSGALIYQGRSGSDYLFTEDIVARADSECIKLGQVRVGSAEDGKAITYSWKAGRNTAVGTLQEWDD